MADDNIKTPDLRYPPDRPNLDREDMAARLGVGHPSEGWLDFNARKLREFGSTALDATPVVGHAVRAADAYMSDRPLDAGLHAAGAVLDVGLPYIANRAARFVRPNPSWGNFGPREAGVEGSTAAATSMWPAAYGMKPSQMAYSPRSPDGASLSRNLEPSKNRFEYIIYNNNVPVGDARGAVAPHLKTAWVEWVGGGPQVSNKLGTRGVRSMSREFKSDFPNEERIRGLRISGARTGKAMSPLNSVTQEVPLRSTGGPVMHDKIKRARDIARRYAEGGRVGEFARTQIDPAPADPYVRARRYEADGGPYARFYDSYGLNDVFRRMNRTRNHSFLDALMGTDVRPEGISVPEGQPYAEGGSIWDEPQITDTGDVGSESYDPAGGREFLGGIYEGAKEILPDRDETFMQRTGRQLSELPGTVTSIWPSSREEALERIGEPKSLSQFAYEDALPSIAMSYAGPFGKYVAARPLGSALTAFGLGTAGGAALMDQSPEARAQEVAQADAPKLEPPVQPVKPKKYEGAPRTNRGEMLQLQQRMMDAGYYKPVDRNGRPMDRPDGVDGNATRDAEYQYNLHLYNEEMKTYKDLLNQYNESRKLGQAEEAAGERKVGLEKFKAAKEDPKNQSWMSPNLGYGMGVGVGALLSGLTTAAFDWKARRSMNAANKLLANVGAGAKGKTPGTPSERAGNVNEFAKKGGAPTDRVPFTYASTQDPPWKPNVATRGKNPAPGAIPASDLYPPRSARPEYITQGLLTGSGLGEMGASMWMSHGAHERLKAAEQAMAKDPKGPNDATIAAYIDARNSANMWDTLDNMGRAWALSQMTGAKLWPLGLSHPHRPDVPKYQKEVGDLTTDLRKLRQKSKAYDQKAKADREQAAADKAAKEQKKAERAAARAAKKNQTPDPTTSGSTILAGGSGLQPEQREPTEFEAPISQEPALPLPPEEEQPFQDGGTVHHSQNQRRNRVGRFRGGFVESKGSKSNPGKQDPAYQGVVKGALRLARQYGGSVGALFRKERAYGGYAAGGEPEMMPGDMPQMGDEVKVGPILGPTGGRADEKPISVPSGSYVVPAHVVAALGGGNTLAGMQALEHAFGDAPSTNGGKPVPIRISDGEFVLSPEQVAAIGRGDVDQGHRILDAFCERVKADQIETLSRLPPPAKS